MPLYDTFGADAVKFIIEHSGAKIVLVNSGNLAALASVLPALKQQLVQVVVWGVDSNDDPVVEARLLLPFFGPFYLAPHSFQSFCPC